MLRSASKILGHRLSAADGEIGRAVDFLIDDRSWRIRYLVVESGPWLRGRRLLLSPLALRKGEWTSRRLVIEGTRALIETAPVLEADASVPSPEFEQALSQHYGWSTGAWNAGGPFAGLGEDAREALPEEAEPTRENTSLAMSFGALVGYGLPAGDGVATVEDIIVDDDSWDCRYLVVAGAGGSPGRKTLVPTTWIDRLNRDERKVAVLVPELLIEQAPEYDPSAPAYQRFEFREPSTAPAAGNGEIESGWHDLDAPSRSQVRRRPRGAGHGTSWGTRGLRAALARIIHG